MEDELLQCPFCGMIPNLIDTSEKSERGPCFSFVCPPEKSTCWGSGMLVVFFGDKHDAIKAWNTRPDSKPYKYATFEDYLVSSIQDKHLPHIIFNAARERKE